MGNYCIIKSFFLLLIYVLVITELTWKVEFWKSIGAARKTIERIEHVLMREGGRILAMALSLM